MTGEDASFEILEDDREQGGVPDIPPEARQSTTSVVALEAVASH